MRRYSLFLALFCFSCTLPPYTHTVRYEPERNTFGISVKGDFSKCKEVSLLSEKEGKQAFRSSMRGGGTLMNIEIKGTELPAGIHEFTLLCDDKRHPGGITVRKSEHRLMTALYAGQPADALAIARADVPALNRDELFEELRQYFLSSPASMSAAAVADTLATARRVQLLVSLAKTSSDERVLSFVVQRLSEALSTEQGEELVVLLFGKNIQTVDEAVVNAILGRPVARMYDRFFSYMHGKSHLAAAVARFVTQSPDSELAKKITDIARQHKESGEQNPLCEAVFSAELAGMKDARSYGMALLLSGDPKKQDLAFQVFDRAGFEGDQAVKVAGAWNTLPAGIQAKALPRMLPYVGQDMAFYKKMMKSESPDVRRALLQHGISLPGRYDDAEVVSFYLAAAADPVLSAGAFEYFNSAAGALRAKGLALIQANNRDDMSLLAHMEGVDKSVYVSRLKEILQNPSHGYYVWAAERLAAYGEAHFDELTAAFEKEARQDKKGELLTALAKAGHKGAAYALDKARTMKGDAVRPVYREIIQHGSEELVNALLRDMAKLDDDTFIGITFGLENMRKPIGCGALEDVFYGRGNVEVKKRAIWTWAYCCPDSYNGFVRRMQGRVSDEVLLEAVDGTNDVIRVVKPSLKDEGFATIRQVYAGKKTKAFRDMIANIVFESGRAAELDLFMQLLADAPADEKEGLSQRIQHFREERGIAGK